jgi:hypothetical protein
MGTAILGTEIRLKTSPSTSVFVTPLQFLRQSSDFQENRYTYESYVTGTHPNAVCFNFC